MKKKIAIAVTAVILIFGTMGIAEMPSPDPDALWKHITKESPEHRKDTPGFEEFSAATYSPTQSPMQYHRRRRA